MITGDYQNGAIVYGKFTTLDGTGLPATLGGTPALAVYKDDDLTQSTAGITLTVDFDSLTGLNQVKIDTSADGTFYALGHDYDIVITAGTVGGDSVVGVVVGRFSLAKATATLADGKAHGGTLGSSNATLALKQVNVTSTGTAVQISSSGVLTVNLLNSATNGASLTLSASGSGGRALNVSGPTGVVVAGTAAQGILVTGATANPAVQFGTLGATNAEGLKILGGTGNQNGLAISGQGLGAGVLVTGGSTGVGMEIDGGTEGLRIAAGSGNNYGIFVIGAGTRAAVHVEADAAGNANAIEGVGDGSGAGFSSVPTAIGFGGGGATADVNVVAWAGQTLSATATPGIPDVALTSAGLDAVVIEAGVNARQAMSIIASACAGVLSGAGTANVLIQAADNAGTNRIDATVDSVGNRSAVTLNPPA